MSTSTRRTLLALAIAATLLPAAPALAQTAPPTAPPAVTPTPVPMPTGVTASAPVIDFGQTVDVTVRGTAGTAVDLLIANQRIRVPRRIRTATLDATGSFTWTGLRPEERTLFIAVPAGAGPDQSPSASVQVRRTVTIGVRQANGVYTFTGQLARPEAGVQVTVARLDGETKRVTGVASTTTDAAGRYVIRTGLPQGLAGYYALTEAKSGLDAGRSRLYGLLVNTRPGTPPPAAQSLTLDVRSAGAGYTVEGVLSPARGGVPVTLAQIVDGRLQGLAGGVTEANGRYTISIQPPPGTYFLTALTANARSRNYGLSVPRPAVVPSRPAAETISQRNAREKAVTYLSFTAFSRSGLIDQLEFDGFSTADATYGTDRTNANWSAQAAKKAAAYLSFTSFSRSGLIDQLLFDGFTPAEAEYGVRAVGY